MLIPFLLVKGANELPREYASGADIVMQDAYPVGINATWSIVWDTPCTVDFGDCGYVDLTYKRRCIISYASSCDDCKGTFQDISTRMDEFRQRLFINGWERTKALWTLPQAFGQSS